MTTFTYTTLSEILACNLQSATVLMTDTNVLTIFVRAEELAAAKELAYSYIPIYIKVRVEVATFIMDARGVTIVKL